MMVSAFVDWTEAVEAARDRLKKREVKLQRTERLILKVRRCRLSVSKPVLKAPMVLALKATM